MCNLRVDLTSRPISLDTQFHGGSIHCGLYDRAQLIAHTTGVHRLEVADQWDDAIDLSARKLVSITSIVARCPEFQEK